MTGVEFLRRRSPWLVFLVAAALYFRRFTHHPPGMNLYALAGACMRHHEALRSCAPAFTYPPAFAFAMVPFSLLSVGAWNLVWYLVTLGATVISYWLAERLALRLTPGPWPLRDLIFLRVTSLVLASKFILAVYENQAYDLFVLPPILFGLLLLAQNRNLAAATSLAAAAALKATPVLFLPYLLIRRRFAAAAAFLVVFVGLSFLPDLFFSPKGFGVGYVMSWLSDIAGGAFVEDPVKSAAGAFWSGPNPLNHSIHGAIARLVYGTTFQADFPLVLHAAQLVFAALVGWLLIVSARREDTIPAEGSLVLIAMLMLSPMTSRSHYVVLLLPYTVLVAYWMRDRRTKLLGAVVLAASFLLATATSNDVVGRRITAWAYATSQIEFGTLVLVAYLAVIVWRPRPAANTPSTRS